MKAILNKTQFCFCDICDKTINFSITLRHISSKSPKHKEKYGTVVREYEFIKPKIDEVKFILNDTNKDCSKKYFPSFEYRCVHDVKILNMENNGEYILTVFIGYMKFTSQFNGLNKKFITALKTGFTFGEIVKITIGIDSSLSNINVC